jgi:ligand-binding SRPBCC domain-containing protein
VRRFSAALTAKANHASVHTAHALVSIEFPSSAEFPPTYTFRHSQTRRPTASRNHRTHVKTFSIDRNIFLPRPLDEVFHFFSDAHNLERLTPPFLKFRVVSPDPIAMHRATHIRYKLRLHGVPISWESEITAWEPPHRFVDEQLTGPYRLWRHEHRFVAQNDGTQVSDHVDYAVLGGSLINSLFVAPDVRRIFDYRTKILQSLFP